MIQSVSRATAILKLFREHSALSLTQVAQMTGLNKTTTHGLMKTLEAEHFLQQDARSHLYALGPAVFELGMLYQTRIDVYAIALPWMKELSNQVGETVQLGMLLGTDVIYISRVTTQDFSSFLVAEGVRMPAHCTATGKCMLSRLPAERLHAMYPGENLPVCTPKSIATRSELEQRLKTIRESGYAVDDEEAENGLRGLAIPLIGISGESTMAICISGTVSHLTDERILSYLPPLREIGEAISRKLGFMPQG